MKQKFKDHKATFTDYGNIKILDFKKPNSTEYRIRFLFEEDYCRLHISGDLGQLVATNYRNMCWNGFNDFVEETGIGNEGQEKLLELDTDIYLETSNFGIKPTGILDLYMLVFKLAKEQLDSK